MGALSDLWKSERGLVACVLIACVTVLAALSKITYDQWLDQTKTIFYVYVGSKTVTGSVALFKGTTEPPAVAATPSAPTLAVVPPPAPAPAPPAAA